MAIAAKLIHLARRNSALDRGAFTREWRAYGEALARQPRWSEVARHVECDAFPAVPGAADIAGGYDGVAIVWHRTAEARERYRAAAESAELAAAERRLFAAPVADTSLVAAERLVHEAGGGSYKLFRFVRRPAPLPTATFVTSWRIERTPLLLELAAGRLKRLVQNFPLPAERPQGWGLRHDCIEEMWFASLADLAATHAAIAADPRLKIADRMLAAETLSVATNEVTLYRA